MSAPRAPEPDRDRRIADEITVDAYGPDEERTGWYEYLNDRLGAFRARCVAERAVSPLRIGEEVEVTGLAPYEDCLGEMVVLIAWGDRTLGVPLAQLDAVAAHPDTEEAVGDWRYAAEGGYSFAGW